MPVQDRPISEQKDPKIRPIRPAASVDNAAAEQETRAEGRRVRHARHLALLLMSASAVVAVLILYGLWRLIFRTG